MTTVERIEHWTELVERWETEGGSQKTFCDGYGIGYASFLSWGKGLRPDGITLDNSDTPTCAEVTNQFDNDADDERVMIELATLTINRSVPQLMVRGRMAMESLRRIAQGRGSSDVPA